MLIFRVIEGLYLSSLYNIYALGERERERARVVVIIDAHLLTMTHHGGAVVPSPVLLLPLLTVTYQSIRIQLLLLRG